MTFTKKVAAGQDLASADFRQYFGDFFSEGIKTGFTVSVDSGLDLNIAAGTAYVKDADDGMYQVVSDAIESLTATASNTNYVYLHSDNGANWLTISTSATVPDDAMLLATVVAGASSITSVTNVTSGLPSYVPPGVIVAWSGVLSSIPSGWLLCDGNNGTPNLIDRFLQGITTSTTEPGTTGGAHSITIGTTGVYADGYSFAYVTVGATFDNRPKYYEVAWIMKA
jgi:hypothetical protein